MGGGLLARKLVRKCWPGEMESGAVWCLFWLSGHPPQAPHWVLGEREGGRGVNGGGGREGKKW